MTLLRNALLAIVLGLSLLSLGAPTVKADDYWDGHWTWYDGSYRPYYQRYYTARPYTSAYYGRPAYYGNGYYSPAPSYGYYGPAYGGYYGGAYGPTYGYGGVQTRVGPVRLGWY